jgi:type VI secretion system protein ImpA
VRQRSTIEVSELLAPIDAARPCGEELGDLLRELGRLTSKQKQEYINGATVYTPIPPEWSVVQVMAVNILRNSKDLRAAVRLAQAAAAIRGLSDFAAALEVIRGFLERYWDTLYPVLELDEDTGGLDLSSRARCLMDLNDSSTTIPLLRSMSLFSVQRFGGVTLRRIYLSEGRVKLQPDEEAVDPADLGAAFAAADPTVFSALRDVASEAIEHACAIERVFDCIAAEQGNSQHTMKLTALREELEAIRRLAAEHAGSNAELRVVAETIDDLTDDARAVMPLQTLPSDGMRIAGTGMTPVAGHDEISSRAEVIRMLDRICAYYTDHEPSSPVPLLLTRARGLVDKSFIDILKDLAPNGLPEAAGVFNSRAESDSGDQS